MARSLFKDFVGKVTEVAAPTFKALSDDILEKIDKHVMNDERRKIFELLGKSFLRLDKLELRPSIGSLEIWLGSLENSAA